MVTVYLIVDSVGAHAPDPVFSVWDSRTGAEAEILRLLSTFAAQQTPPYLSVVEVQMNTPSDTWVNG